jgi:xylulokinase
MGVTLSAGASLAWWAAVAGQSEAALIAEIGEVRAPAEALFLPYLSGERTPHNDGAIRGAFAGLSQVSTRSGLTQAVLEGVAFSMRDCLDCLVASGTSVAAADVIGGGGRSRAWVGILAAVLGMELHLVAESEHGAAFGAARLARLAVTGEDAAAVCTAQQRLATIAPEPELVAAYAGRLASYRALYPALKGALP